MGDVIPFTPPPGKLPARTALPIAAHEVDAVTLALHKACAGHHTEVVAWALAGMLANLAHHMMVLKAVPPEAVIADVANKARFFVENTGGND